MSRTSLQLVMKISKYCNLRCSYCYEFNDLGNKARMQLSCIERIFEKVSNFASQHRLRYVRFNWHGGEPFLIPIDYYEKIRESQILAFRGGVKFENTVQTNLTVLPQKWLDFIKDGKFFGGIGISFDVCGTERVDKSARSSTDTVLRNIQKLIDEKIDFGAIAVLDRYNIEYLSQIIRFYDYLRVDFRLLPFYLSASDKQASLHAISHQELVQALCLTFDFWIASRNAVNIDPVDEYTDHALAYICGGERRVYDKQSDELVFIVDPEGYVTGMSDTYDANRLYGNLSSSPMSIVLSSQGRAKVISEADERLAAHCAPCEYFGYCPGHYVAEASPAQRAMLGAHGCPAREVIRHIVYRLEKNGLIEKLVSARASILRERTSVLPL